MFGPVFQMPMWRVGDEDMFRSDIAAPTLPEAVFSYSFWPIDAAGQVHRSFGEAEDGGEDRRTPGRASNREMPLGTTFDHAVESAAALGEPRGHRLSAARPRAQRDLPVVHATDGGTFAPYARRADVAAIEAGLVPHVLVVAAHSAGFRHGKPPCPRAPPWFRRRPLRPPLSAFVDAGRGRSTGARPTCRRAVFGCSDGGGHALATGRPTGPLRPRYRLLDRDGARTG